jgi:membrane-bound ClpP family serine protease
MIAEEMGGLLAMRGKVNTFLVLRIITSLLEQAVLVAVVLWGLPRVDINLPLWVLIPASIVLQAYNVFSYRRSIHALRAQPIAGMTNMVGIHGQAVNPLTPDGLVKIRGELWAATAANGNIVNGRDVIVVEQSGLKLVVRESDRSGK